MKTPRPGTKEWQDWKMNRRSGETYSMYVARLEEKKENLVELVEEDGGRDNGEEDG